MGPLAVVETFKEYIDEGDLDGMLSLYGEKNERQPLKRQNYAEMRPVMERYVRAWKGAPFIRGQVEVNDAEQVVYVRCKETSDLLKFYTRPYLGKWYISDLEVHSLPRW